MGEAGQARLRFVHLDVERNGHVATHEREAGVVEQMRDVLLRAREEIVDANHVVAVRNQPLAGCDPRKPAPPVTRTDFLVTIRRSREATTFCCMRVPQATALRVNRFHPDLLSTSGPLPQLA